MVRFLCRRSRLVAVVATVAGALLVSAATAAAKPQIVIGPIKVRHGYSLTITASNCNGKASLDVYYLKGKSRDYISHDYSGPMLTCKVARSLRSGSLAADWPGALAFELSFRHGGGLIRTPPGQGCHGSGSLSRAAHAHGLLEVGIHAGALGKIRRRKVTVAIERFGALRCTTPRAPKEINVLGTFGQVLLSGSQPRRGLRNVFIDAGGDDPAPGVNGNLFVSLEGGKSLFSARKDMSSAHFGAVKHFTSGSLTFSALPACPGSPNARNGSFSGAMTVDDPGLGAFTLVGSSASLPWIARGNAIPGTCNGG
jgi:hypothetical protein